jgi:hypothetical protein
MMNSMERPIYRTSTRLFAPLVASALFLSGCTDSSNAPFPKPTSERLAPAFEPSREACAEYDIPDLPHTSQLRYAAECLKTYHHGKVALIDYDMNASQAQQLAGNIETRIKAATNSLITLDVSVVPASNEAKRLFTTDTQTADCLSVDDTSNWGSYVAEKTMPRLAGYDLLLSETNLKSCNDQADGVAEPGTKYAQIFNANRLDGKVTHKGNGIMTTTTEHNDITTVAVHELLHEYGLGHAGILTSTDGPGGYNSFLDAYVADTKRNVTINLETYLKKGDYSEYGDDAGSVINIMGDATHESLKQLLAQEGLNAIQLDRLRKPYRITTGTADTQVRDLTTSPMTLSSQSDPNSFGSYAFKQGLPVPAPKSSEQGSSTVPPEGTFDRLVFLPSFESHPTSKSFIGTDVYLTTDDSDMSTVSLGTLYPSADGLPKSYDFTAGSDALRVTVSKSQVHISKLR